MTEHEAIKDIQRQLWEINSEDADITLSTESLKMAIKALEELQAYKDAEEQGLLIRLPCKVGDAVYFTDRKYDRENRTFIPFVHNGYVKAIKFSARPTKITIEYEDLDDRHGRCKGHDIHASNIGKTVFLTREEAEAKLAEMQKG